MKRKVLNDVHDVALLHHQSSVPLVKRILKLQQLPNVEDKSFGWMQNLRCLSIRHESAHGQTFANHHTGKDKLALEEVLISSFDAEMADFVVISYPWHASRHEDGAHGAYTIRKLNGGRRKLKVRNVIIRRIINYVQTHALKGFWIDRECINQRAKAEKSRAVQSMDRLYALSPRSIGMLSTHVNQQWKMDFLQQLMEKMLVRQIASNNIRLALHLQLGSIWKMIRYFVRLVSDSWWHRCWIYQEEYCASHNMTLLIPCNSKLKRKTSVFGTMSTELEIRATDFRRELTRFALACMNDQRFKNPQKLFLRRRLLRRIERYSTTFEYGCFQGHTLSSIIVTDLQKRSISKPEDLLPIVANCCNYSIRLNPEIIKTRKISLSLALFTQALLNGEVLFNKRGHCPPLVGQFSHYFQRQVLGRIRPPAVATTLTFFKHIRFPHVQLSREGIGTFGQLWHIVGTLSRAQHKISRDLDPQHNGQTDLSWFRVFLQKLAIFVRSKDQKLSIYIAQFACELDSGVWQREKLGARQSYMLAMARDVDLAIEEGRSVYIGRTDRTDFCRAVFVAESNASPVPHAIFTAWHDTEDQPLRNSREPMTKHVSVEVDIEGLSQEHGQPLLRIRKWVNGLYFSGKSVGQRVVFPWPEAL